jgi:hypothetical protein
VADLVSWVFHSPRRLLLVVGGVLVLVIGLGAAARVLLPGGSSDAAPSSPAASASVAGSAEAVDAAVSFTRAWASKPGTMTAQQWHEGLQRLVTPDLGRLLESTDPADLPGGTPSGPPTVRFVSGTSALVEVPLSTGQRVLVTVVQVSGHWLVQDVQPASGDLGDVSPGAGAASSG